MQEDRGIDSKELQSRLQHLQREKEERGEEKIIDDYDIYKQSDKVIRNSSTHKNSLLNRLEPFKSDDVFSHRGAKTIRDYKQELTFLKNPQTPGQFIAYCIVKKESNSGMFSHERLLLLDSQAKAIKYFSKIPHLPIKSFEEINEHAKQQISILQTKKFTASLLRSGIGEVQISWLQAATIKKWNIKMGNNQLAREFCLLVDNVKTGKHLSEGIEVKRPPDRTVKVNKKATNFITEVNRLEEKLSSNKPSLNQSFVSKIEPLKKEQVQQSSRKISQPIPPKIVEQTEAILHNNQHFIQQQKPIQIELPQTIQKQDRDQYIKLPPSTPQLEIKQSLLSIKIQQIIKQAQEHQKSSRKEQPPQKTPTVTQLVASNPPATPRLSEIERILHNRRVLDAEDQSIATIKHLNKEHEQLGMSKLLVKNIHRKSTNKQQFQPPSKEKYSTPQPKYYKSEKPATLTAYRQTLLQQRRQTELPSTKARKTFILNQHSQPRQQKSRSRSKSKDPSRPTLLPQRQWLLKWTSANTLNEKAEVYGKFIDHCTARVQKLASGFGSWHIFHKQYEEYVIKQNGVEYTYQMIDGSDMQDVSIRQERALIQKLDHLDYTWRAICSLKQSGKQPATKLEVPLSCLISYKGLKVLCKAQLASDSLLIQQIHGGFSNEIKALEDQLNSSLKFCSIFLVTSNKGRCIYIHEADIQSAFEVEKGYLLTYSFITNHVPQNVNFDAKLIYDILDKKLIPSFLEALRQFPPMTSVDFESMLEANHLHYSLLPLIYEGSKHSSIAKCIISEACAFFLEQQVRQRIHSYLMRKEPNKSMDKQITFFISKSLRLSDEDNRLAGRIKSYLGVSLSQICSQVVEEYVVASLLIRLSMKCRLEAPSSIQVLQTKQFDFWKQFQFDEESIHLSFTPFVQTYHFPCFSKQTDQILTLFSQQTEKIEQFLKGLKQMLGSNPLCTPSPMYQVMPPMFKQQLRLFFKYTKLLNDNSSISQLSLDTSQQNGYYYGKDCIDLSIKFIKKAIKLKNFDQAQKLIKSELVRAWIWCRSNPFALGPLYGLLSFLNLQRHSPEAVPACLKSLQQSIHHYESDAISITTLMEKTFKAAEIHTIFNDLPQALNFNNACQEIFQQMIKQNKVTVETVTRYLPVYVNYVLILLNGGRLEESVTQAKNNIGKFNDWRADLKNSSYQLIMKVYAEQFEHYLILFRCYELLGKRSQMIQLIEECSVKFIQNYILTMIENKKPIDPSLLSLYRFREIAKCAWQAILVNCHSKKVTYHQYFSKVYNTLRQIDLTAIRDVLLAIQKDSQGNLPLEPQEAMSKLAAMLYTSMPANKLERLCQYTMESFLVEACIKCLSALSSPTFLEAEEAQQEQENSKQLEILSWLLSLMGYDYCLGTIELTTHFL